MTRAAHHVTRCPECGRKIGKHLIRRVWWILPHLNRSTRDPLGLNPAKPCPAGGTRCCCPACAPPPRDRPCCPCGIGNAEWRGDKEGLRLFLCDLCWSRERGSE